MTAVLPTSDSVEDVCAALEPVRRALLADARADADRIIGEATREAALTVDEAEQEAAVSIERAVRHGTASAQARSDQRLAQARAEVHGEILRAQDQVRRRLHHAVHTAALDLRSDPRYPDLLNELERLARNQLGPNAQIKRDVRTGGIVAIAGSRRVDYTLPALAERALDVQADKVTLLWS
jgi:vacuolar-type H+-ATPase subunit E/Vma4